MAVVGVVSFAVLTALSARVVIPLPTTPVPITLQTLAVVTAGMVLGPRLGTASMLFYLLLGLAGNHVFAWGNLGLATLTGATGGYLLGFVLAQPAVGVLSWKRRRWSAALAAGLLGHAIIFACGLLWLSIWAGTDLARTWELGFWPFLPGTVVKTLAAAGLGGLLSPWGRRHFGACACS